MRILLINREVGTGSVGKIVEDLYFGIVEKGNDCIVAYGNQNKSKIPSKDLIKVSSSLSIKLHALFSRISDRSGFYSRRQTKKLIELIKSYKPDIIHIHGLYGYWLNIKLLLKFLSTTNIKVIDTLHSCWDFTGHCCYFIKSNCNKRKTGCFNCPEKRSYPKSFFLDNSAKNYKEKKSLFCSLKNLYFVSPSEWMTNLFKDSFLTNFPVFTINNGVDLNAFRPITLSLNKYGINLEKPIILGVASVRDERKGLSDFIELSKLDQINKFQIVLIGVSKKLTKKLPENIICIERTDNKSDLAALYSAATVLFNPTYEDNYPTVNLEAIACGTPVITYNSGGSSEIVYKTGYGDVIRQKDYNTLFSYLNKNFKKSNVNLSNIKESLSKETMIQKYNNLYEKIYNEEDIKK